MSNKNVSSFLSSSETGFIFPKSLLTLLFIGLKLLKVINWSWWLVLLPLYGSISILFLVLVIFLIIKIWFTK